MEHIHESLPRQGTPKFIARIWNNGCLIFYETESFENKTKEQARDLIKAKVALFKQENKGLLNRGYKVLPTKSSKHGVVGVFKCQAGKKAHPAYYANVSKNGIKRLVSYSVNYFGDDLALELAVRMSKTLRICIDHPLLLVELDKYKAFKRRKKNFRIPDRIEKAINEIVERYEELEEYCLKYKLSTCRHEKIKDKI